MTTTSRQNNLILNQDWTRIYQTFKNADFKSYDFENLRRVMIEYIRENYPEDFNDYVESSEYLALIDVIAFLGQSLSFRIDLASRENFIELAERKESVLRLARMLSYNAKRNISATGLLKIDTISTTEDLLDSNGRNLSQQTIVWNDPTNTNWNEQFLLILNAAMAENTEFGRSQGSAIIEGIPTEQYRFNTVNTDIPIFSYSKNVAGRRMAFEIVSTAFKNSETLYEEDPYPGNQLGFVYKQDGKGPASSNNGFFLMFKQGSLEVAEFSVDIPTTNESIAIDSEGINDSDVWLFSLDSNNIQVDKWVQVSNLIGNNIAFNSLENNIKNFYTVVTKENDKIDINFSDGIYGNLPQGNFRLYYRVSNGLSYVIPPADMRGITISIPYLSKDNVSETLTVTMSLKYTVSGSSPSEDIDAIRLNAPANYYIQNRMITAEDYNLAPLTSSQDILKVRAINRISSGISRNFDIIDASGKYSSVDVFADDGYIYKNENETSYSFKFVTRLDILNFVRRTIEPIFTNTDFYNFYLTKFTKIFFIDSSTVWVPVTSGTNESTGYFINTVDNNLLTTGAYTNNTLKYLLPEALIKFISPEGKAFKFGALVDRDETDPLQHTTLWTKVVSITGDGTNAGRGALPTGFGPIRFTDPVPLGAIAYRIVPRFVSNLPTALETQIVNLAFSEVNFGLRYDINESSWKIILGANLNLIDDFSLGKTGDTNNVGADSSWLIAFVKDPDRYRIRVRTMEYIFGSVRKNRFYFDPSQKIYDSRTNKVIKDQVKVLGINTNSTKISPLNQDLEFEISDVISYEDGYQSTKEIKIGFADSDDDGVVDDPDQFLDFVGEDSELSFLYFQLVEDEYGNRIYEYLPDGELLIQAFQRENDVNINDLEDGQLVYFYTSLENVIKRVDKNTNTFVIDNNYRANVGRANVKFQYLHHANVDRRIDPSVSNIIDIFLLTKSYDTEFRNYLKRIVATKPIPPSTESLRISFGTKLNEIKTISDEIVYHPVEYKVLFGSTADEKFRATFKIVKNPNRSINDNDLKVRVVNAIDEFFDVDNWDFGDKFYLSELTTYVLNETAPDISNMIIVPEQPDQVFGSLFEIQSRSDEIFVSGATVDNIQIVAAISANEINVSSSSIVNTTG